MVFYGIDIVSDYNKYGGFTNDFYTAAWITTISTIACVGVGLMCTGYGAPLGATLLLSVSAGFVFSYCSNECKKQFIGY